MRRRTFLGLAGMTYVAYIAPAAAADDCTVVLLAHYDTAVDLNEASYYLYVEPGGSAFSGYDLTADACFGSDALDLVTAIGTEMSVWLNEHFDPLALPFGGKASMEWRMKRPGGLQSTGLGNSESSFLAMELRFSDSDILYVTFGYYGSDFPAQDQGAGFRVFTENGPAASGIYRETGYGWTDDEYHAIRLSLDTYDTVHCHVDGDFKVSIDVGPLDTGTTLDSVAFFVGKTSPETTDAVQIDEIRVMSGRALSGASDYTPATGPWTDATCDSGVDEPSGTPFTMDFEGIGNGNPVASTYSAQGIEFSGDDTVYEPDEFDGDYPPPSGVAVLKASSPFTVTVSGGFGTSVDYWQFGLATVTVQVFDIDDNLLASGGDPGSGIWIDNSLPFSGIGSYVTFSSTGGSIEIDDITLTLL